MASLNVAEWTPEQVSDWLSGVEGGSEAAARLAACGVGGARLLALRCDDLHYFGIHVIGHQELLLEAVEHLRNFHYEMRRECVQQLAVRVSAAGAGLARALRGGGGGGGGAGGALETQALADVARLVSAVKPLACWLARWPLVCVEALAERRAALLKLALEAATCAQRDRFAEQPARAVAAAAAAAAATADYIIQDVSDPGILAPASLECVCVRQGDKPLGFALLPSACGHHQLAHVRFGSPAHASGQVHEGDEIVCVGSHCVVGWAGARVEALCRAAAARCGDLPLQLRRRGARPPPAPPARPARLPVPPPAPLPAPAPAPALAPAPLAACTAAAGPGAGAGRCAGARDGAEQGQADGEGEGCARPDSSDESDALSPPASPTHLHADHTRMYPPKPARAAQRRHSVSGGSPVAKRPNRSIEQFWRELREQQWERGGGGSGGGGARISPDRDDCALYRHKAVSCSTGLELSPRPRTCLGVALPSPGCAGAGVAAAAPAPPSPRGKLDKSHSTPAYSLEGGEGLDALPPHTPIPESPTIEVNGPRGPLVLTSAADGPDEPLEALNPLFSETSPLAVASATNPHPHPPPPPLPRAPPPPPRAARAAPPPAPAPAPAPAPILLPPPRDFPALKIVPRQVDSPDKEWSPLKPLARGSGRAAEISLPLRHLTALDLSPAAHRPRPRPPPALNADPDGPHAPLTAPAAHPAASAPAPTTPELHTAQAVAVTSSGGATRGLFPSAKTRSLKKKNSLLAKRRAVPWRALCGRGAASVAGVVGCVGGAGLGAAAGAAEGAVWQRVRARGAELPRWARRHLLLVHNVLYAYRSPECLRADCMIQLAGWVVCPASEVRSRQHAFKVYHTGRAVYFAADSKEAMCAWIQLLTRATLAAQPVDASKQYSETDYSETESDLESSERHERERDSRREKEKDKSKFGSLKKLTSRMSRSESSETVGAASLDRRYLRIFSRKPKIKSGPVPVPTEHYRSYRRVSPSAPAPASPLASPPAPALAPTPADPPSLTDAEIQAAAKLKVARYAHASNPNLAGGEWRAGGGAGVGVWRAGDGMFGFVTLEEFMLKKQEEERKQVYTNRVLMGIERSDGARAQKEIQKQLEKIIPDVIYGELPDAAPAPALGAGGAGGAGGRALPPEPAPAHTVNTAHGGSKPISIKGKDGYEKIVYPEDIHSSSQTANSSALSPERWRDSLRRNQKVHSGSVEGSPHLVPHLAQPAQAPAPAPAPAPAHNTGSDSVGASPGGVSRLRLMFSSRSASRDTHSHHSHHSTPSPQHLHTQESPSPSAECAGAGVPPPRRPSGGDPPLPGGLSTATYPHLQCPPTFQPETYSLTRAQPPHAPHTPHTRRHHNQ